MNRPDAPRVESRLGHRARRPANGPTSLPAEAAATASGRRAPAPSTAYRLAGLEPIERNRFAVTVAPALGHHAEQRLVGCLEDSTVPRILGEVARVDHR